MYVQELIDLLGAQAPRCKFYVEKYWELLGRDPDLLASDMMENMYLELVYAPDYCSDATKAIFNSFLMLNDHSKQDMLAPALIFSKVDISLLNN